MSETRSLENDQSLLRSFAEHADEGAFRSLVDRHIGLVFSASRRRCGDAGMADEACQNAFAILARKAGRLVGHPSLPAWLYRTALYEVAKIQRRELSRKNTMRAYQEQASIAIDAEAETLPDAWEDAKPDLDAAIAALSERDRTMVLQRYYEDRSYAEIAGHNGRSEAACRMRVSRALAKLSRILTARGVTLSAAALAAGLGAKLAGAAPAGTAVAVSSASLSIAPTLTSTSLIIHSIQTMNATKTTAAATILIFAASAIPIAWQASQAKSITTELEGLSAMRAQLETELSPPEKYPVQLSAIDAKPKSENKPATMTGAELVAQIERARKMDELLTWARALQSVSLLDESDLISLLSEVQKVEKANPDKENAYKMLIVALAETNRAAALEQAIALKLDSAVILKPVDAWATEDPRAAFTWFREQQQAGAFEEKMPISKGRARIAWTIAKAAVKSDIAFAVELATRLEDEERRMLGPLSQNLPSGGATDAQLREFLGSLSETERVSETPTLIGAIRTHRSRDAAGEFVESLELRPEAHREALLAAATGRLQNPDSDETKEIVAWILTRTPEEDRPQTEEMIAELLANPRPQRGDPFLRGAQIR